MERKKQRDVTAKRDPPVPQKKRDPLPMVAKIRHGVNPASKPLGDKVAHISAPERVGLVKEYERYWWVSAVSFTSVQANEWSISLCTETVLCIARSQNPPMNCHPKVLVNAYGSLKLAPTEISCVAVVGVSKRVPSTSLPRRSPSIDTFRKARPPKRIDSDPLDLESSPPSPNSSPPPAQEPQTTPPPEEWPASQTRNRRLSDVDSQDCERAPTSQVIECEDDESLPNTFDDRPPTPAQRPRSAKQDTFPSPPASSPACPSPSPSLAPASTSTPHPSLIAQLQTRAQVERRVPYPVLPPPPNSSSHPRILAPNSEPSQPQSQRSPVPSKSQLSTGSPCLTPDLALEDKEDESHVRSYLFTQPEDYDGDQSVTEPHSKVMNTDEDIDIYPTLTKDAAQLVTTDHEPDDDNDSDEETNEGHGSHGRVSNAQNENSDSVVPDSQGDQLDDDDAQISESLFGKTQSYVVEDPIADPMSVIEASVPDELPSFAGLRHGGENPFNAHDQRLLDPIDQPRKFVSDHDPDTWRFPAFMRDAKGKQKASTPAPENRRPVVENAARSTAPSAPNGDPRVTAPPANQSRLRSPAIFNHRPIAGSSVARVSSSSPAPPALGQTRRATVGIPNIDFRSVSVRPRKRSRLSEYSFDFDGIVESSVAKKRRTWDTNPFKTESTSPRLWHHDESELNGSRRGRADEVGYSGMTVSADARRRLKEFVNSSGFGNRKPNDLFGAHYDPSRPPWMSWPALQGILLQTGRYRDKQAKQMTNVGEAQVRK